MATAAHAAEQNQELGQSESDLGDEELRLAAEVTKLLATASEFERKIKSVRAAVAEAAVGGADDPAMTSRLNGLVVPTLEAEATFASARRARAEAVEARMQANQHVRDLITVWKQKMNALHAQLLNDEKAAQQLVIKRKEARERVEAPIETAKTLVSAPALPPALRKVQKQAPTVSAPPAPRPAGVASKRQSPRVKMQAAVDLTSDNNFFSGFSANISDGGIFIATVNHLPQGTHVDVSFSLPTGERISAAGVVRWHREVNDKDPGSFPGVGIQFTDLDASAHEAIHAFIVKRDPLFYVD